MSNIHERIHMPKMKSVKGAVKRFKVKNLVKSKEGLLSGLTF
jgi:hypothetical protein